jgi:hypothetical protein
MSFAISVATLTLLRTEAMAAKPGMCSSLHIRERLNKSMNHYSTIFPEVAA